MRLLYECYPLAYVIEQAGGEACDEREAILDIIPKQIHQRNIAYLGSKELIDNLKDRIDNPLSY